MIPVFQTVFGEKEGNCLAACIASLLELEIEDVPNFTNLNWYNDLCGWLNTKGYTMMSLPSLGPELRWLKGMHYIGTVKSTLGEGVKHATIWLDGKMIHNPHPDYDLTAELVRVNILVPLDPARFIYNVVTA